MIVHRHTSTRSQLWRNRHAGDHVNRLNGSDGINARGVGNGKGNGNGNGKGNGNGNGKGVGNGIGFGNQKEEGTDSGTDSGNDTGNDGGSGDSDAGAGNPNSSDGGSTGSSSSSAPVTRSSAQSQSPSPQPPSNVADAGNILTQSSTSSSFSGSLAAATPSPSPSQTATITSSPLPIGPIGSISGALVTSSGGSTPPASPSESTTQTQIPPRSQQLSKGATAGIIITILFVLPVIVVFLVRLRNKIRRRQHMEQSHQWWFGSEKSTRQSGSSSPRNGRRSPEDRLNTRSMRSSFGTNIDRGLFPSDDVIPSLPPIAEIDGDSTTEKSPVSPNLATNSYLSVPIPPKRDSEQSIIGSPTSVRPLLRSQSLVRPTSVVDAGERLVTAEGEGHGGPADFNPVTETIRRPYFPSNDDELRVVPGDVVNVIKPFQDGWCFCQITEGEAPTSLGVIPIDCLRDDGEPLPASLTGQGICINFDEDTTGQAPQAIPRNGIP